MYKITHYSKQQAKKLGVKIKPSTLKNKKIDVFNKENQKVASIGHIDYGDYPTFIQKFGRDYADLRRNLYRARFAKQIKIKDSPAYYNSKILW